MSGITEKYENEFSEGRKIEKIFDYFVAGHFGFKRSCFANLEQEWDEHWDIMYEVMPHNSAYDLYGALEFIGLILKPGDKCKVEIKGEKATKRGEAKQSTKICFETHGAGKNSNHGWIFGTKADFYAFLLIEDDKYKFLFLNPTDVKEFVKIKMGAVDSTHPSNRTLSPTERNSPHYENLQCYHPYYRIDWETKRDRNDTFFWAPIDDVLSSMRYLKILVDF